MRQGPPNGRRPRGRHHGGGGTNPTGNTNPGPSQGNGNNNNRPRTAASLRHQTFDSNCIELRVRGNAWQVHEKYQALARDAQSSGDRVAAENYLQHAEHYYRIIEAINEATAAEQRARGGPFDGQQPQQQPAIPPNYYGNTAQPQPATGDAGSTEQPAMPPAEVEMRNKSPFFTPEEAAEDNGQGGPAPLIAQR